MKVILLLGSSSTGKSTRCGEFAKNHQWKVSDTDKFYNEAKPKAEDAAQQIVSSLSLANFFVAEINDCAACKKTISNI